MPNDTVKTLSIDVKLNNVKAAQKEVEELKNKIQEGVELNVLPKGSEEWKSLQTKLKLAQNNLAKSQGYGSLREKQISELAEKALGGIKGQLLNIASKAWDGIVEIAKDAWKEIKEASIYSSSSKLYSSQVTNLKMQYGFSGSEAYAFEQAFKGMSLDDIAKMTPEQRDFYTNLFNQYLSEYEKMEEKGVLQSLQDVQLDWEQFQRELKFTFMDFIADNKGTIKTALDLGIDLANIAIPAISGLLKAVTWIANKLTGYSGVSSADVINNWTSGSTTRTNNQTNNFTIIGNSPTNSVNAFQSALNNSFSFFRG